MKKKRIAVFALAASCAVSTAMPNTVSAMEAENEIVIENAVSETAASQVSNSVNQNTTPVQASEAKETEKETETESKEETSETSSETKEPEKETETEEPENETGSKENEKPADTEVYTLTAIVDDGVKLVVDGQEYVEGTQFAKGSEHTFVVVAEDERYSQDGLTINGVDYTTNTKTITVDENLNVRAKSIKNIKITVTTDEHGSAMLQNGTSEMYVKPSSGKIAVAISPDEHYYTKSVKVNDADVEFTDSVAEIDAGTEDIMVTVGFDQKKVVSVNKTEGGSVQINGEDLTEAEFRTNEKVKLTIKAADGFDFEKISNMADANFSNSDGCTVVEFEITEDTTVDISFKQQEVVNVIAQREVIADSTFNGIVYTYTAAPDHEYEIVAAEDIYKDNVLLYANGAVIETLKTNKDGIASSSKIFHGLVKIRETNSETEDLLEFSAAGVAEKSYAYEAEKIDAVIKRLDKNCDLVSVSLITKSPIMIEGGIMIPAGTVIATQTMTSDETVFSNIPNIKYAEDQDAYDFIVTCEDGTFLDENGTVKTLNDSVFILELATKTQDATIYVKDAEGNSLSGAVLKIEMVDPLTGEPIADRVSYIKDTTEAGAFVSKLPTGTYRVSTVNTAPGYIPVDEDSKIFEIKSGVSNTTTTLHEKKNTFKVEILDETDGKATKGAVASLYRVDGDGNEVLCSEFGNITPGTELSGLKAGKYILKEKSAPTGYQKADEITFSVDEKTASYEYTMQSKRTYGFVSVELLSSVNRDPLADGEYELADGDTVVSTFKTGKDGKAKSAVVPIGTYADGEYQGPIKYTLYETKAPEGYQLDTIKYNIEFAYLGDQTPTVSINALLPNVKEEKEAQRMKTVTRVVGQTTAATSPKTGDASNPAPYAATAGLSLFSMLGIGFISKRKKDRKLKI